MKMMTFAEYVRLHKFTPRLYFSRGWESSRTWSELEQKMDPDPFSEGIARALWRNYEQTRDRLAELAHLHRTSEQLNMFNSDDD
jgi:hypothetical protein